MEERAVAMGFLTKVNQFWNELPSSTFAQPKLNFWKIHFENVFEKGIIFQN